MTVNATTRRAGPYIGNGIADTFDFEFKVFAKTDLRVVFTDSDGLETDGVLDSDYRVTMNADQNADPGGTVTYQVSAVDTPLPTGTNITLLTDLEYEQTTDITNGGGFYPQVIEDALDRNVVLIQQLEERTGRAITLAVSTPDGVSTSLPAPVSQHLVGWDVDAERLVNYTPSDLATVVAFAEWQSQYFSGDGVTTQFVLSSDPGNVNNLDVSIGGAGQGTNDFSLSGTTLTFTVAPPTGAENIYCRWGQALPQEVVGDGAIKSRHIDDGAVEDRHISLTSKLYRRIVDKVSATDPAFGAVGDGVSDDTAALQAAIDYVTALPFVTTGPGTLVVPFGRYRVTGTVNATCNVVFEDGAHLYPSGVAANAVVYNIPAGAATTHIGVYVLGNPAVDVANGTIGISVNQYRSELTNCGAQGLKYGGLVKTFSVSMTDCNFNSNYCNLSAYAPTSGSEINDLKVFGGNYATVIGGGKYAIKIGDRDFATSVLTTNSHGNNILLQGFALDGGAMHIDSANQVKVDTVYFENLPAGQTKFIEIGTAGFDGLVNNVKVDNCLFKNGRYAVYANIASRAIYMRGNQCTSVTSSALYLQSDIYPAYYEPGLNAGSFTQGKEVHTGCRSLTMASELFGRLTLPGVGLYSGVQDAPSKATYSEWFGPVRTSYGEFNNYATSGSQRFYTTPAASIAGHVSDLGDGASAGNGLLFKCTTLADCYQFNGGDYLTGTGPLAGVMYVRRVDYEAGVVYLFRSGGPTNGAATISQAEPDWFTTVYRTAVPASGDWKRGDRAINSTPTVGQPKSWVCTVAGTPGTWVSEGNL